MTAVIPKRKRAWQKAVACLTAFCLILLSMRVGGVKARASDQQIFDIGVNTDSVKAELSADGALRLTGVGDTRDFSPSSAPFAGLDVRSVEIGAGVSSIGAYLFYNCGGLSGELILPGGLISIGDGAFSGETVEHAPRFSLIENEFVEATITRKKAEVDYTTASGGEKAAGSSMPVKREAAPNGVENPDGSEGDTVATPSQGAASESASLPESSSPPGDGTVSENFSPSAEVPQAGGSSTPEETVSGEPEDQASPSPEVSPSPSAAPSPSPEDSQYALETITEQLLGRGIFSPGSGENGFFLCSQENRAFLEAVQQAGYTEAERLVSAAFDCGEGSGGTVEKRLPVSSGTVVLPELPSEISAPSGNGLFVFRFNGWTEAQDEADAVHAPGELFQADLQESLYFIASWSKDVLVRLTVVHTGGTLALTVPEIEGYDVTSVRWQMGELTTGEAPHQTGLSVRSWQDIGGQTGRSYERKLQPGDEDRAFRAVITVAKQGILRFFRLESEEELILSPVRGTAAASADAVSFAPGSYEGAVISGDMPAQKTGGGKIVVPECAYLVETQPGADALVFCGWKDDTGKRYHPGDLAEGGTTLTAQWDTANVVYVCEAASTTADTRSGASPETACSMARGFYLLSQGIQDQETAIYRNVMVVTASFTALEELSCGSEDGIEPSAGGRYPEYAIPFTITSAAPGGADTGAELTLCSSSLLHADTRFTQIKLQGNGGKLFAETNKLVMGNGVVASGMRVYGAGRDSAFEANTDLRLFSGEYANVFGAGDQQALTGNTRVVLGGNAVCADLFGGGDQSGSQVTGSTEVMVAGGTVNGSVYGGGLQGAVSGSSRVILSSGMVEQGIYGGGAFAPVGSSSISVTSGTVRGSVFGAGCGSGSTVSEGSAVSMAGGSVQGNIYGGGELGVTGGQGAQVMVSGGTVSGSVFGAGKGDTTGKDASAGRVSGPSQVQISGGRVLGSVFGGGDQGVVGEGSLSGTGSEAALSDTLVSSTLVSVTGGIIETCLYGGGSGSGCEDVFGAVFGSAQVQVTGGTIHGSIFGGGNRSYISGNTEVSIQNQVTDISIGGTVYGGGNLPGGEVPRYQETYLVQGNTGLSVDGSGPHSLSIGGSLCGEGNLTVVKGQDTKIVVKDFHGELRSIQRSSRVDVIASDLQLIGAEDAAEQNTQQYSLSRVGELRLFDGTLLRVDKETCELGALGNFISSAEGDTPSSQEAGRSTLQLYPGRKLQVKKGGVYGSVSGVLWLDIVTEAGASGGEYGVTVLAGLESPVGDGSTATGALVKAETEGGKALSMVSGTVEGSHCFWRLGNAVSQVELTLQAVHQDSGGSGIVKQAFTMSTSSDRTVFEITKRTQTGGFTLVKPTENADGGMEALPAFSAGQEAGNTFALRVDATDSEGTGSWVEPGTGSYILTSDEMSHSSAPGVWNRDAVLPTTADSGPGAGNEAEVTLQLLYSPEYLEFQGGTLELVFEEHLAGAKSSQDTLQSITVVKIILEGERQGASRETYVTAGRRLAEITSQEPAPLTASGAVTAYFVTQYYPVSAGAAGMALSLYRTDGEVWEPAEIPEGTEIVLADRSNEGAYHYYWMRSGGQASLPLSGFASMGGDGSAFYPGPVDNTAQITEKLLFAVDFSGAGTPLATGDYALRLSHGPSETAMQTAPFTIVPADPPTLAVTLSKTGTWTFGAAFTPTVSPGDTRYADGALVRMALTDFGGIELGFPGKIILNGAENLLRSADGSVSFQIPGDSASSITLDFSKVSEEMLPSDLYGLRMELRPRTGLQVASDAGEADYTTKVYTFELEEKAKTERAIGVTLKSGERVVDVSEAGASLQFTVEAKLDSGDKLSAVLSKKTGDTPEDKSYSVLEAKWCAISALKSGKADAVLTVPKGTESGTYRVVFQVVDSGGTVLAQEPYNFIVK